MTVPNAGIRFRAYPFKPWEPLPLQVGDKVKFGPDRIPYTVRALNKRWVVCTRPTPFVKQGQDLWNDTTYSIIDWERGWRGPMNFIGGGADCRTDEDCRELVQTLQLSLDEAEATRQKYAAEGREVHVEPTWELSHRSSIYLTISWWERDGVRHAVA